MAKYTSNLISYSKAMRLRNISLYNTVAKLLQLPPEYLFASH